MKFKFQKQKFQQDAVELFKHKIFDSNQEQFSNNVRLLKK